MIIVQFVEIVYDRISMKNDRDANQNNKYKRIGKTILIIVIDIVLIGVGLVIFALFHHVIPDRSEVEVIILATPMAEPTPSPAPTPSVTMEIIITPEPTDYGMWGEKFDGKFTKGDEVIRTDFTYISHDINITVEKKEMVINSLVTYYIADIYVRNIENFRTGFAEGGFAQGVTETVKKMALENDAIVAITGDYYGIRKKGLVVRNGVLYRDVLWQDLLILNYDGSMETYYRDDFSIETLIANGAYQGWSFGPMLLYNGQPMTKFNSTVSVRNPRSSVGYYEPGHYCFILVDGRRDGYSRGLSLGELSQVYYDLGCKVAYNLDGGQSAVMIFNDEIANIPFKGGRKISDILYIGESEAND